MTMSSQKKWADYSDSEEEEVNPQNADLHQGNHHQQPPQQHNRNDSSGTGGTTGGFTCHQHQQQHQQQQQHHHYHQGGGNSAGLGWHLQNNGNYNISGGSGSGGAGGFRHQHSHPIQYSSNPRQGAFGRTTTGGGSGGPAPSTGDKRMQMSPPQVGNQPFQQMGGKRGLNQQHSPPILGGASTGNATSASNRTPSMMAAPVSNVVEVSDSETRILNDLIQNITADPLLRKLPDPDSVFRLFVKELVKDMTDESLLDMFRSFSGHKEVEGARIVGEDVSTGTEMVMALFGCVYVRGLETARKIADEMKECSHDLNAGFPFSTVLVNDAEKISKAQRKKQQEPQVPSGGDSAGSLRVNVAVLKNVLTQSDNDKRNTAIFGEGKARDETVNLRRGSSSSRSSKRKGGSTQTSLSSVPPPPAPPLAPMGSLQHHQPRVYQQQPRNNQCGSRKSILPKGGNPFTQQPAVSIPTASSSSSGTKAWAGPSGQSIVMIRNEQHHKGGGDRSNGTISNNRSTSRTNPWTAGGVAATSSIPSRREGPPPRDYDSAAAGSGQRPQHHLSRNATTTTASASNAPVMRPPTATSSAVLPISEASTKVSSNATPTITLPPQQKKSYAQVIRG